MHLLSPWTLFSLLDDLGSTLAPLLEVCDELVVEADDVVLLVTVQ